MMSGHDVILWTVRVSVAFYAISVWLAFSDRHTTSRVASAFRFCWTASWLWCVIHVLCAFHFQHHWDHTAALKHTSEMTHRVVGIHWSGGLYINYVFLTVWAADIVRLFRHPAVGSSRLIQWVAAFMMFNATVVFGPRWWWIPLILLVAALLIRRMGTRTAGT